MLIHEHAPLAPLTTLRVGGPARFFVRAGSEDDLRQALAFARRRQLALFVLGGGTNVLAADEGFPGLVVKIENSDLEVREDGTILVGAGVPVGRVVQEAAKHDRSGLEWAAGLPGTVGGAVFGNAGAFGHETGEFVAEITAINLAGALKTLERQDVAFRYRWSSFKDWSGFIIVRAVFVLQPGKKSEIEAAMKAAITGRYEHQPLPDQSAGCIFKNPSVEHPAGKLIDACGLKGLRVGGAAVSARHANFIVNTGTATARDIAQLILVIKQRVYEQTGIELEEEVRYLKA